MAKVRSGELLAKLELEDLNLILREKASVVWACGASWADPEGAGSPDPHLKNHKNIGFLCNTGPDLLKNHKAAKPAYNVGPTSAHQRNAQANMEETDS